MTTRGASVLAGSDQAPHPAARGWRPLRRDRGLHHHHAACRAWADRLGDCRRCSDACPVQALLHDGKQLMLHSECIGCGRCVPACPMGALSLMGLLASDPRPVKALDCRRVPAALRSGSSVPCLGSLTAATLLRLVADGGPPIRLLDRGWCQGCSLHGRDGHPAHSVMAQTHALLAALAVPPQRWPRLDQAPLPQNMALPAEAIGAASRPMSRRAFLGRLARELDDQAGGRLPPTAAPAHPSLARQALMQALRHLSERAAGTKDADTTKAPGPQAVPPAVLPALHAHGRCRDHQGCVQICPTGALKRWRGVDSGGIEFDAGACIACGLCERHCPQQALSLGTSGGTSTPLRLTRHQRRACVRCGTEFSAPAADDTTALCDTCAKSQHLAQSLFQQFFAARG